MLRSFTIKGCLDHEGQHQDEHKFVAVPTETEGRHIPLFARTYIVARLLAGTEDQALDDWNLRGVDIAPLYAKRRQNGVIEVRSSDRRVLFELAAEFPIRHLVDAARAFDGGVHEGERRKAAEIRGALGI